MTLICRLLVGAVMLLGGAPLLTQAQTMAAPATAPGIIVPYEPSPDNVVDGMLSLGGVGPQDILIDLGSGDGRIVIAAAKKYGARAMGIELNPDLVRRAQANAQAAGVADRATFRQQDIFETDLSPASIITMFLYPRVNLMLRPRLLDLPPGTRIVSHFHDMADWRPDQSRKLPTKEHYGDTWIFLWVVPAKVAGDWHWREARGGVTQRHVLTLRQTYQRVEGSLATESQKPIEIRDAKLNGAHLTFWVPIRDGGRTVRWDYQGHVENVSIVGVESTLSATAGLTQNPWRAMRSE